MITGRAKPGSDGGSSPSGSGGGPPAPHHPRFSRLKAFVGEFGLEEVADELEGNEEEQADNFSPEAIFNAQQVVLANVMVVSALLLGFIVTGTLLSIGLTGRDNFGISELMNFFNWSALATCFAFISLITSFLTSVWGAHRMTTSGPVAAMKALTEGSVFRQLIAEGSLYMSMLFFLVSLYHYIWMVYSGPDICPAYRGEASFCARQGEDLYFASQSLCMPQCPTLREKSNMPKYGEPANQDSDPRVHCPPDYSFEECLCREVCVWPWEEMHNWSSHDANAHRLGIRVHNYHFFGYRSFPTPVSKPTREKIMAAASSLMCNHGPLEDQKDACFQNGSPQDCTAIFMAWEKSEECMDNAIEDTMECAKVCAWTNGMPPKDELDRTTKGTFIPLGVALICLTLGRVMVILVRAYVVCHRHHSRLRGMLGSGHGLEDGDSDSSHGG